MFFQVNTLDINSGGPCTTYSFFDTTEDSCANIFVELFMCDSLYFGMHQE